MAPVQRRVNPSAVRGSGVTPPSKPPVRPAVVDHAGKGYVRSEMIDHRNGNKEPYYQQDYETEVLRQRFTEDKPPAHVRVGAGLTINMGNFESLRVDVSVSLPTDPERLEEAYQAASDFCAEKINEEQAHWLGQDTGKQRGKGR